jgi:hypothetical protein
VFLCCAERHGLEMEVLLLGLLRVRLAG